MQAFTITTRHATPLTYYKTGQGPILVIINAYGITIEPWAHFIEQLKAHFSIIIWELRGIRNSDKPNQNFVFGVEEHSADLEEIIAHEKVQNMQMLAWCGGIKPAIHYYHAHPAQITALISVAGNFTPFSQLPSCKTEWDENMTTISQVLIDQPSTLPIFFDVISNAIQDAMAGKEVQEGQFGLLKTIQPQYIKQILQPMFSEETMANYLYMINQYYHYDISAQLLEIKTPLLLLVADKDMIAHPQQSQMLSTILPQAQLVTIDDATHYMIIEQPQALSAHILKFADTYN